MAEAESTVLNPRILNGSRGLNRTIELLKEWPTRHGSKERVLKNHQAKMIPSRVAEKNCQGLAWSKPNKKAERSTETGTEYRLRKPRRTNPRKKSSSVNGATITRAIKDSQGTLLVSVNPLKRSKNHWGGGKAKRSRLSNSDNKIPSPRMLTVMGSKSMARTEPRGRISPALR